MAMLVLDDIRKVYPKGPSLVAALRGVNLSVSKGEFVCITGPSGSGKSTLLNIMGAVDWPSSGRYLFEGRDLSRLTDAEMARFRNRRVGFVFQSFNLLVNLTALENVCLPLTYRGLSRKESRARALEALSRVGLSDRANHYPDQLSGGEEQRVAFARAIVTEPDLLIADEPTGNLDSHAAGQVVRLMKEANARGTTVVLATHNLELVEVASRHIVLQEGTIRLDSAS